MELYFDEKIFQLHCNVTLNIVKATKNIIKGPAEKGNLNFTSIY
jgi:hypothetical protein